MPGETSSAASRRRNKKRNRARGLKEKLAHECCEKESLLTWITTVEFLQRRGHRPNGWIVVRSWFLDVGRFAAARAPKFRSTTKNGVQPGTRFSNHRALLCFLACKEKREKKRGGLDNSSKEWMADWNRIRPASPSLCSSGHGNYGYDSTDKIGGCKRNGGI